MGQGKPLACRFKSSHFNHARVQVRKCPYCDPVTHADIDVLSSPYMTDKVNPWLSAVHIALVAFDAADDRMAIKLLAAPYKEAIKQVMAETQASKPPAEGLASFLACSLTAVTR